MCGHNHCLFKTIKPTDGDYQKSLRYQGCYNTSTEIMKIYMRRHDSQCSCHGNRLSAPPTLTRDVMVWLARLRSRAPAVRQYHVIPT